MVLIVGGSRAPGGLVRLSRLDRLRPHGRHGQHGRQGVREALSLFGDLRWHYRHYTRIPTERERARKRERERDRESTYFSAFVWHCYSQPSDGFTKATFVICMAHI